MSALKNILERFETKWLVEKPPFPESVIEAALLLDLFRDPLGLGFNAKSAKRQQRVPNQNEAVDILLRVNPKTRVVVEIKQPGTFDRGGYQLNAALKQAGRYARALGQQYGIVTDGYTWIYVKVLPFRNYHLVHQLVRFNLKSHRQVGLSILDRSRRRTLKEFLDLLAALHVEMTLKKYNELVNQGLQERVNTLVNLAKERTIRVRDADKKVLRELYSGDRLNELVRPLLAPLKLTGQ